MDMLNDIMSSKYDGEQKQYSIEELDRMLCDDEPPHLRLAESLRFALMSPHELPPDKDCDAKSGDTAEYLIGLSEDEDEDEDEVESKCPESFLMKHTGGSSPVAAASKKREREMQFESTGGGGAKTSWPEVVGWSGEAAVEQIEKDNGNVVPIVVKPEGGISSMQEKVRPNIVKIFVDDNGIVTQPPIAG